MKVSTTHLKFTDLKFIQVEEETMKEIIKLLKQMYDLSIKEDWDEPIAQFLVMEGGDLYADYFRNNN